jgi:hypothetical protein
MFKIRAVDIFEDFVECCGVKLDLCKIKNGYTSYINSGLSEINTKYCA